MAVSKQLREDLLRAMGGVTQRRLNQVASARAQKLLITHEEAVYVVAHEHGLKLAKYLGKDEQAEMRAILSQSRTHSSQPVPVSNGATRTKAAPKQIVVTIAGFDVEQVPGMTATHAREAKVMAERVYPRLYVFENSARDLISRVLKDAIGDDWWDKVVPAKTRAKAESRKADEAKDPWHGKRGAALIDYLDLTDLPLIVNAPAPWPHFKKFFDRPSWFQELVNEVNVSRRVVAHMNPLEADDVKNVEAAFRKWAKLLKAKADLIP